MDSREALASILVDHAIAADLVPWACPCEFEGRYRLEELIAGGPHSLLYRATDKSLSSEGFDATVAIKILRGAGSQRDEALTTRRVVHPNVLATLDRGTTPEGLSYLVAEFVDGGDLSQKPAPLAPRTAAGLMAKVASAVQAAHSAGVVHCDLKPANILLTKAGEPKLADFGLSRWAADAAESSRGNIAFMSPEQFEGREEALTPPSDIYALGGVLFHLLTGRLPHGDSPEEVTRARRERREPPSPGVERDLDLICTKAMAVAREQRYHSAGDMADDLRRWLGHEPLAWSRPSLLRRAALGARRQPLRALVVSSLLLGTVVALSVWRYNVGRDQARQAQAQADAVRIADEKVEATRAMARKSIEWLAKSAVPPAAGDIQERILPWIVWVQWLAQSPVIQNDGHVPAADERILMLKTLIIDRTVAGKRGHLDVMMAQYALAHILVAEGDFLEAGPVLEELQRELAPRLADGDPVKSGIGAMRLCTRANEAAAKGESAVDVVAQLRETSQQLERSGDGEPIRRLIERVLGRLSGANH